MIELQRILRHVELYIFIDVSEVCDAILFGVRNFPWTALTPRSKTSVTIHQSRGYNIPEDLNFQVVTKQASTEMGGCVIYYGWARVVALLHSIQTDYVTLIYSRCLPTG